MLNAEDDFDRSTADFLAWFGSRLGAQIASGISILDLRSVGRGRGVVATRDFAKGEILFSLPPEHVLNINTSRALEKLPKLKALPDWLGLVAALVYEEGLGPRSKWHSYLQLMPITFDTLMYWSDSELQELQGSAILKRIGKESAESQFKELLLPILRDRCHTLGFLSSVFQSQDSETESIEILHRMATLVMSYSFDLTQITAEGGDSELSGNASGLDDTITLKSMIPLADLLNADGHRNNATLWEEDERLQMLSIKPIVKGEEIFNDYGDMPRSDLLRRYGYITENHQTHDVVEIKTEDIIEAVEKCRKMNQQSPLSSSHRHRAQRMGIEGDSFDLGPGLSCSTNFFDSRLLVYIATLITDVDNPKNAKHPQGGHGQDLLQSVAIRKILREVLHDRQTQYPTSLMNDVKLLQDKSIKGRHRMAIEVRLGEKRILAEALAHLENRSHGTLAVKPPRIKDITITAPRARIHWAHEEMGSGGLAPSKLRDDIPSDTRKRKR